MTATLPARGPSTPVGGPTLTRRLGIVYGFDILDHHTNQVVANDYVGQSVRALAVREDEHRGRGRNPGDEQPWSDRIVGAPRILEQGMWTSAELDEREQYWITTLRPRMNYMGNGANPDRIPKYEARRQRAERDRAAGIVSRWTDPDLFAPRQVDPTRVPAPVRAGWVRRLWSWFWRTAFGRWLLARLIAAGKVAAWWLGLAVAACAVAAVGAAWLDEPMPAGDAAGTGALVATAVVVAWAVRRNQPRQRRNRGAPTEGEADDPRRPARHRR